MDHQLLSNNQNQPSPPVEMAVNPAEDRDVIVEVKDLKVVYFPGKSNEAMALKGIDLKIYREEYITFFGPSGCGKSTLLNIIAGLEVPSSGSVIVDGQNLSELSSNDLAKYHRRKTGMIFQSYNLIPTLNVLDNVLLPQVFERIKTKERKDKGRIYLKKLGLEILEKRLPQELSGGQQQRVGIARALINNPPIILADEAVGNLDSQSAQNVLEILDILNTEDKKTIISVTHNPEHLFYADRIFYMRDGQVIKVEVNEKRKKVQEKAAGVGAGGGEMVERKPGMVVKPRTALDLLLQAYPDLTSMQMHIMLAPFKAKMLVAYLLTNFNSEEIYELEKIVAERLAGRLSAQELFQKMDDKVERGGLGLSKPLARKFCAIVEEVFARSESIRQETALFERRRQLAPLQRAIINARHALLDSYDGELTFSQVESLNKGIEYRLLKKISMQEFQEYLDRPYHKGGVGLNKKTAKAFARKLELIMLMEYGK